MMVRKQQPPRFVHRDISWILFNRRVILEAYDDSNPLLEQLRFLGIAANNLDEFFMVRVPRMQSLARLPEKQIDKLTGWTQEALLEELTVKNRENLELQYQRLAELEKRLAKKHYYLKSFAQLTVREAAQMGRLFKETIFPTLAPMGVDAYHAFPRLLEKALHLWVGLKELETGETREAILPISNRLPRVIQLSPRRFILIEEVIAHFLPQIFVGNQVTSAFVFRITYDHDLTFEEDDQEDLSQQMSEYLEERKKGLPARLEVGSLSTIDAGDPTHLLRELGLCQRDLYQKAAPIDLTFLFDLVATIGEKNPAWLYPPAKPLYDPRWQPARILKTLDHEDLLLQHPYDSFRGVLSLLEAAVKDPDTIAIKQTLYRMAKDSQVIKLLKKAAKKGIQVTVLVEIKARFDEASNLHWVEELEAAGCFVSYGFPNMKTHSKALLIVQNKGGDIKRYAQFGTGNYNESNSQQYTDISFFTAREEYVSDLTDFFNYLTGYRNHPQYQKIVTSPEDIRQLVVAKIQQVMADYQSTGVGKIFAKMNALTDPLLIEKLYEASQVGVPIHLQVRGACCLVPQVPGLSETIQVSSIVGRFLEHARIYAFTTSAGTENWISSADWMTRNMVGRVEIATPINQTSCENLLTHLIQVYESDQRKAYFLHEDGEYCRLTPNNGISAQAIFLTEALRKTTNIVARQQLLVDQLRRLPK